MGQKITPYQACIIGHLSKVDSMTKKELMEATGADKAYYGNSSGHFSAILSRMVKRQLIYRPKKGTYSIGPGPRQDKTIVGQLKLDL